MLSFVSNKKEKSKINIIFLLNEEYSTHNSYSYYRMIYCKLRKIDKTSIPAKQSQTNKEKKRTYKKAYKIYDVSKV